MSVFTNEDNLDLMRRYPDNYFDLAIVDPPYFTGPERRKYYGKSVSTTNIKRREYHISPPEYWIVPTKEYFDELLRVSKNQIVWGCNNFDYIFPGAGRIVWDKCNGKSTFSDCEIAYCSSHDSVRMFRFMWNGMMQGKSVEEGHIMQGNKKLNEKRIHPTQKPVALYEWLLTRYAKQGDIILDTHVGSGSSLIACERLGFEYVACDIDPFYFAAASERIAKERDRL